MAMMSFMSEKSVSSCQTALLAVELGLTSFGSRRTTGSGSFFFDINGSLPLPPSLVADDIEARGTVFGVVRFLVEAGDGSNL